MVAATIVNSNPYREKGSRTVSPLDFVPELKTRFKPPRPQPLKDQIAILTAIFGCGPGKQN